MPEHPIEARARAKAEDVLKFDSGDMQTGFCLGARFGYGEAVSDMKERLAAAESCVEYLRTLADAQDVLPTASKKLVKAYDDAVKEINNA